MISAWYVRRGQLSWLAAALVLGLLLSPWLKYRPSPKASPADDAMLISMTEIAEAPASTPLAQPLPKTPTPPRPAAQPAPSPAPAEPAPQAAPTSVPAAAGETSRPTVPASRIAETPAPPPAPVNAGAKAEDSYIAGVRAYLNSIKRYPTGREASIQKPRGKARVWFVLDRDGRLQGAGIEESSDSLLLDRTALATVQRGAFAAFPDTAWSSQATHRFVVELEFIPGG
jgi:protein TonB